MNNKFSPGRIIAFFIGLAITGFLWTVFFPAGGSGANILLGVFVVVFFLQYFMKTFGGYIDQEFFPKGSKERARLYRGLQAFVKESKHNLGLIKKSKKRRAKIGASALDDLEKALLQASLTLNQVDKDWQKPNVKMAEHEKMLQEAHNKLELANGRVFFLQKKWRFLYGVPSLIMALLFALFLREFVVEPYQIPSGSMIPTLLVGDHLFVSKLSYGIAIPFSNNGGFVFQWKEPQIGDVVIFKAPNYVPSHAGQTWIKRLIAKEGQTIQVKHDVFYVDDKPYVHLKKPEVVTYMDYFGFGTQNGEWREQVGRKNIENINGVKHQIYMSSVASFLGLGAYWPINKTKNLPGLKCDGDKCLVEKDYVFVSGDNRGHSSDSRVWGALHKSAIRGKAWCIWMSVDGSEESFRLGPISFPKFRLHRWFKVIE